MPELSLIWRDLIERLNDRQRIVIYLWLEGYYFREIASIMQLSARSVSTVHKQAIKKLKIYFFMN